MERITNDTSPLLPVTDTDGSVLPFDFPAVKVGIAEYREGPTGCTVFSFPQGVSVAIDLAGNGGQGVYYLTETLLSGDALLNALCFAGGSLYGFEAMTGVAAEMFSDFEYSLISMAFVSGAILFDFGPRTNVIYPDKALGRAAFRAAKTGIFPLGAHGAGCSASVGKGFERKDGESAGQGGAFRQIGSTKIAVFTVVNARGALLNRQGQVVRGHLDQKTGQHYHIRDAFEQHYASLPSQEPHMKIQRCLLSSLINILTLAPSVCLPDKCIVPWRELSSRFIP